MFNPKSLFRHCPILETRTQTTTFKRNGEVFEVAYILLDHMRVTKQRDNQCLVWVVADDDEYENQYVVGVSIQDAAKLRLPTFTDECSKNNLAVREQLLYMIDALTVTGKPLLSEVDLYPRSHVMNPDILSTSAFDLLCKSHVPDLTETMATFTPETARNFNLPYLEKLGLLSVKEGHYSVPDDKDSLELRLRLDKILIQNRMALDEKRMSDVNACIFAQTRLGRD